MYQNTIRGKAMLVGEIMTRCAAECTEDTPVEKVYEMLQGCEQGFVVVIDSMSHRVPLGIVNEHSICEQVVAKGRKLRGLTAGGVLDSSIKKIPATANVEECSDIFQGSSRAAVVVDQKGGLCGLLTAASLPAAPASTSAATSQRAAVRKSIGMIEIPAFGWVQ